MANRKARRKQHIDKVNLSVSETTNNGLKVFAVVAVIFIAFYFITSFLINKINLNGKTTADTNTTEAVIQYDNILLGEVFSMSDSDYYVLFYDASDTNAKTIESMISTYKAKKALPIYTVDMSKMINSSFMSNESNPSASQSSDLKINGITLIRITSGKNTSYTEGIANVAAVLK